MVENSRQNETGDQAANEDAMAPIKDEQTASRIKNFYDTFSDAIEFQKPSEGFTHWVRDQHQDRIKVYQRNYLYSLIDCLSGKYTAVEKVIGEHNFRFLARTYILASPSTSTNLDDYGYSFAEFLESRPEVAEMFYLGPLARIDRFWFDSFDFPEPIGVMAGSLHLWQLIQMDAEIDNIELDPDVLEYVSVGKNDKGEFYLYSQLEVTE